MVLANQNNQDMLEHTVGSSSLVLGPDHQGKWLGPQNVRANQRRWVKVNVLDGWDGA